MIHVRFEGKSYDFMAQHLGLTAGASDAEVLDCLARHFEVGRERFGKYVVDRGPSSDLIVRPEAVYG
jgi:hypothetical protein